MKCIVKNCNSTNNSKACEMSFFLFPTDPKIQIQWLSFCGRGKKINPKTAYVCMLHFQPDDVENRLQFEMGFAKKRLLKPGTIPSIKPASFQNKKLCEERASRIKKRENKKMVASILKEHNSIINTEQEKDEANNIEKLENLEAIGEIGSENTQPNIYTEEIENLRAEVQLLRNENQILKGDNNAQISSLRQEILVLKTLYQKEVEELKTQIKKTNYELENIEQKLSIIFTRGQISKLKNGMRRQLWTEEDITQSITLYATSSKLYKLLYRKNFPLPSVRTLQSWAQKVDINKGLLKPVFKVLSSSSHMSEIQKLCVLSFDEMKIKKSYCYNKSSDTTLGPVSYAQVAMVRGLISKWKQPIFYNFDCRMTKSILFEILEELKSCGYTVVAMVSDLGGGNRALLNELGITEEAPWFLFKNEKVFSFADVPHMIKLLRNHFIDSGFIVNQKIVQKDIITKLLEVTSGDVNITHKISVANLNVTGAQRQKVKLATKLFSHTVAQAITRAASHGLLDGLNWSECHQLFKVTNDWFDIMNVRVPRTDARTRCHAYGLAIEEQNLIIDEMTNLVNNMRAVGRKSLLPFQKGIIQSNNALKGLYKDLKTRYSCEYILTYRLNQDVLENFFGIIRSKGGLHDHPDQEEFRLRLRSYILGRNDGVMSHAANVEVDDTPDLERTQKSLTGIIFSQIDMPHENIESGEQEELTDLAYDGLENLAGYICHRLKEQEPNISVPRNELEVQPYTWIDHLSEGGLSKPTEEMMGKMQELHTIFNTMNNEGLLITEGFLKKHIELAHKIDCSEKIKKIFFRARMYFKIRTLNHELHELYKQRKRKINKTLN